MVCSPDEHLPQVSRACPVNELLCGCQLQVHVSVGGDEKALVLVAPLELDHNGLTRKAVQEGLRVHGHGAGHLGGEGGGAGDGGERVGVDRRRRRDVALA